MIEIKKKSELTGAERFGDCISCGKRSNETDLYQISFRYENSTKDRIVDICFDCMCEMGDMIVILKKKMKE